jgi:hypothetical protein
MTDKNSFQLAARTHTEAKSEASLIPIEGYAFAFMNIYIFDSIFYDPICEA